MNTLLYEYCGKPSLKGVRCKKRDRALAVMARPLFRERTGLTPEEFVRRTPDRSGWLQDLIIAQAIVGAAPL